MKTTLIILCFFIKYAHGQIIIKVANENTNSAIISIIEGEKIYFVDSITSDDGEFRFNLADKHSGIYRLTISSNNWIDFIYDNEEVEIVTDANNILENFKVIKSESNKIYYEFVQLNKAYKTKTELLQLMIARYPKDDDYYQTTKEKIIRIQEDYLNFVNITAQENSNSFIARYVRSSQLPVVDTEIPLDKQLIFLKTHALDNVNFYDADLVYSNAFTNKSIEYITYYRNPQLPLELLEKEFTLAVDSVLDKARVNAVVYQHIVEYLLDGFKKFGFDNVLNYVVENYVIKDDLCLDQKLTAALEKRIDQSKKFKIGALVPNIVTSDLSGSLIELKNLNSENMLILFYSSWCPHCQTLLPQVYEFYKNQKGGKFEVLAISIDTSNTDWLNFVQKNNLNNWINVCDFKGWEGKTATDYCIYATPTMFLVGKEKKLLGMPKTIEEIKSFMAN